MKVISDLLGHSSLGITADIYTEVVDALKAEAASRMDGLFR
jgi:integrase